MDRQYGHVIGNPSDYGGIEYAPQQMMVSPMLMSSQDKDRV